MKTIAVLGFGVVGGGTVRLVNEHAKKIESMIGEPVYVKYILDLRDFPESPYASRIVHDIAPILDDPDVSLIAELMGGSHPAYEYSLAALTAGKHVVTSNKECVSRFGAELTAVALAHGVCYRFEASCGGGIPVIQPILCELSHNRVTDVAGILNGTTNYILTRMDRDGSLFGDALREAQTLGYAERDPSADVLGLDVRRKINILCACVNGELYDDATIPCRGIDGIRQTDVKHLAGCGYKVKLLGRYMGGYLFVSPHLIPIDSPLSSADGVFNAVLVRGDFVGDVMFWGRGAGADATASAVVADITAALSGARPCRPFRSVGDAPSIDGVRCPRYFAMQDTLRELFLTALPAGTTVTPVPAEETEWACLTSPLSFGETDRITQKVAVSASLPVFSE